MRLEGRHPTPAYSERLGQSLALVHVAPSAAQPGTPIRVDGPTVRCAATVAPIPFVDPERVRLRAPLGASARPGDSKIPRKCLTTP